MEDGTTISTITDVAQVSEDKRISINLGDPDLKIQWALPLEVSEISAKDKVNPMLKDIHPVSN